MRNDPLAPPIPLELSGPVAECLSKALDDLVLATTDLQHLLNEPTQRTDGPRAAARLLDCLRRAGGATKTAQRFAAYEVIEADYLTWRDAARALGTTTATLTRWRADVAQELYRDRYPDGPAVDPLSAAGAGAPDADVADPPGTEQ